MINATKRARVTDSLRDLPATYLEFTAPWLQVPLAELPQFYTALGIVVCEYAELDLTLSSVCTVLMKCSAKVGDAVVHEMSFPAKVNLIRTLASLPPERDEQLKRLLSFATFCNERRNAIMHSSFHFQIDGSSWRRKVKAKGRISRVLEKAEVTEMITFANFMNDLARHFRRTIPVKTLKMTHKP